MEQEISLCQDNGLRITPTLKEILGALKKASVPMSLADLEKQVPRCDPATIYRTIKRLKQIGVIRQLNFSERGARYALTTANADMDYLICEGCGKVEALETPSPFQELKKKLMESTGFRNLSHELEFYGVCSQCD